MNKVVFVLFIFIFQIGFSQQAEIYKLKNYRISILNDSLKETSGLDFFQNKLFTFNDSGNSGDVFEIDKNNGRILKVFKTNLVNTDWEALTSDSTHFYIGDFGNNAGTRKDLKVIKINFEKLNSLTKNSEITVSEKDLEPDIISFYYPEQKDFKAKNLNTDFDAEAMIYLNGNLHIFTKEWASKATTHYIVDPKNKELQAAKNIETFKTSYAVTDAAYFEGKLYLVGYTKKTEVFLDIFKETENGLFFKEKPKRYYLGSVLSIGQVEGIAVDQNGIYISAEKFSTPINKPRPYFYFIPKDKLGL